MKSFRCRDLHRWLSSAPRLPSTPALNGGFSRNQCGTDQTQIFFLEKNNKAAIQPASPVPAAPTNGHVGAQLGKKLHKQQNVGTGGAGPGQGTAGAREGAVRSGGGLGSAVLGEPGWGRGSLLASGVVLGQGLWLGCPEEEGRSQRGYGRGAWVQMEPRPQPFSAPSCS